MKLAVKKIFWCKDGMKRMARKRKRELHLAAREVGTRAEHQRFCELRSCTIVNLHGNRVEVAEYSTVNVHGKSAVCDVRATR